MIQASFARPVGLFDNWFNKVVTWLTAGNYCHSEFIFTWDTATAELFFDSLDGHDKLKEKYVDFLEDDKLHICFYVLWGDRTGYRLLKHSHNNPFYRMPNETQFKCITLPMNQEDEFAMAQFLLKQIKKPYDYAAALGYFLPVRSSQMEYPQYYCSELMVCALQHVRLHQDVNPSSVTPNRLYAILSQ